MTPLTVDRRYDVVAMSFPIVYTLDGDHDPDGLLYTLSVYVPLLSWARDQWEEGDRALPRLHRRRQLTQLVVDGLWRYEQMLSRLEHGPWEDRGLVHDLGGEQDRAARDAGPVAFRADHRSAPERGLPPRALEVRQNFLATVDELVAALSELTDGAVDRLSADPLERAGWLALWKSTLQDLDLAIETRLARVDASFDAAVDGLSRVLGGARVGRLLLNDRRDHDSRDGQYDRFNPLRPVPLIRPLVLRARRGETVEVRLTNSIDDRDVGIHVQGANLARGVELDDGAHVGANGSSLTAPGRTRRYRWRCDHEGTWPFNDLGDVRGSEQGTNVHGLFGALVVEPSGARWRDPETGELIDRTAYPDGLYVDIVMEQDVEQAAQEARRDLTAADPGDHGPQDADEGDSDEGAPGEEYVDLHESDPMPSHREFVVFLHDEPEIHSGLHVGAGEHTVMPLSYRAEPMPNRLPHRMRRYAERTTADYAAPEPPELPPGAVVDQTAVSVEIDDTLAEVFRTARTPDGRFLDRVAGEEQHHSSWLFGEPVTPVFRAYRGDPARLRVVHAGVKETHVFHLHVHQWHAVPQDTALPSVWKQDQPRGSQLLDSITIGPQTAVTIDPLYGSGSRQHAFGDVIWHCHLYPHFHHGMWGLWRSFDRLVDGTRAYPDGTPCHPLRPLPGRRPAAPTQHHPGFPWFIDATFPQKSPPPPAVLDSQVGGRRRLLGMPAHSSLERAAMPAGARARARTGAVFVDLDGDATRWNAQAGLPPPRVLSYDVEVLDERFDYNSAGWHDPHGHRYRLTAVSVTPLDENGNLDTTRTQRHTAPPDAIEPFHPRANHGDIVELRLHNSLGTIPADHFDLTTPPVECGLHVHLVKFDVLAADGSSTGWNYLSGASCREAVGPDRPDVLAGNVGLHRWVVDEEFGPCFFHDHLLANYRQKHGLFAALIAEPHASTWTDPAQEITAWAGTEAVVLAPDLGTGPQAEPGEQFQAYREACLGVGDFVPLYDRAGRPLNPPHELSGDDDPGSMGVNYRSSPLTFRGDDPSQWFSAAQGEPDTPVIRTYAGDRLRLRLIQGSHEEQHSFNAHGLRWRRQWHDPRSTLVDQQTLGISEAFTLDLDPTTGAPYGPGDHLWQFAALDDLWLGCWGLVRALPPCSPPGLPPGPAPDDGLPPLPRPPAPKAPDPAPAPALYPALPRAGEHAYGRPGRPFLTEAGDWSAPVREYVVVARRVEHPYDGLHLTDPWGLAFLVAESWEQVPPEPGRPDGCLRAILPAGAEDPQNVEPLVLRARPGEWVRVILINEILDELLQEQTTLPPFGIETSPPRLPLEHLDELGYPDGRTVSPRVSLHPGLLLYDTVSDDGSNVGTNLDSTVGVRPGESDLWPDGHGGHGGLAGVVMRGHGAGSESAGHVDSHNDPNWREYWWYVDHDLAPDTHHGGPGQVALLRDCADVRNHRHHGLVGALVVEPPDVTPVDPDTLRERWDGTHVLLAPTAGIRKGRRVQRRKVVANEKVLVLQDGIRHFVAGDPESPVRDTVPGDDPEDAGQKGINYRVSPVHPSRMLHHDDPATPIWPAQTGERLWLHLVSAADKPRNHTFTVHGHAWHQAPWLRGADPAHQDAYVGSLSGLTAATVHSLDLGPARPGDHAFRSGVFRWAVPQGLWGILRVTDPERGESRPREADQGPRQGERGGRR